MPPPAFLRRLASASGQASVELVALLPLLAAVALLAWQAVVAGQAIWLAGAAARAAARAHALGADPTAAARDALPGSLAPGVRATPAGDGAVSLSLAIPSVVEHTSLVRVHARARFAPQEPST